MIIKYSVVIPTLWKSNRTTKLLVDLQECEYVDEIIIIDNSYDGYQDTKVEKIRFVSFGENIYVNPAWNKGIELAKNNLIALVNDDINFNPNIFGKLNENSLKEHGFIGASEENYNIIEDDELQWKVIETNTKPHGWGCLIMFHKENWIPIPNELKIWYGDNFITEVNPVKKSILINFKIETEMSTTSDEACWNSVKNEDTHYYILNIRK